MEIQSKAMNHNQLEKNYQRYMMNCGKRQSITGIYLSRDIRNCLIRQAAKFSFLTRSTAKSEETIKWTDGKEYPLVKVMISSASHPFFTGEEKIIDTEGRVDRFKARAERADKLRASLGNKVKKAQIEAKKKAEKKEK